MWGTSIEEDVRARFAARRKKRKSYAEKSLRAINKEVSDALYEWKASTKPRKDGQRNAYYWHNYHWKRVGYTDALDVVDPEVSVETIGYVVRITNHRKTRRKTIDITPEGNIWRN